MFADGLEKKRDKLLAFIGRFESCAVAFSGGVDSAVVAKAARLALAESAVAVTAVSLSLAEGELESAQRLAREIGIRHEIVRTAEFANTQYTSNAPDRCYYCKTELYARLDDLTDRLSVEVVLNGANADDAGDYRPGLAAAHEHQVESPLAACGFAKADVRALATYWKLSVADKPASPCLSSRVAYGEAVTPERLAMIDAGEQFLRSEGLENVRVRYHKGDLARVEVPPDAVSKVCQPEFRARLVAQLKRAGFRYVTLDLEGFRSGSQNEVLPVELLHDSVRRGS